MEWIICFYQDGSDGDGGHWFFCGRGFSKIMPKLIWFDYGVCACEDIVVLIYAISRFRYHFYWSLRMCMVGKSRRQGDVLICLERC